MSLSLARVLATANLRALELGVDKSQSLITIAQTVINSDLFWRVNYGPKDFINQRGGDLIIDVDPFNGNIRRVLRGQ